MDGSYAGAPLPGTESFKGTVANPRLSRVHPVASWAFGPLDAISCCWRSLSEPPPIALRGQLAPRCVLALHSSLVRRRISPAGTGGAGTLPVHSRGRDEAPCSPALGTGPGP